jgi:uncharacterized protein YdeI (BOF family)
MKHYLSLGLAFGMLALAGIRTSGATLAESGLGLMPAQAQAQEQPKQDQAQPTTFTGTIVKDGDQFLLKDASGQVYKLDDSGRAQPYEGKAVKVTGKLDTDAKLIHVESIEAASA